MISKATIVVHDQIVRAKLRAAAPRILLENKAMVTQMLDFVKVEVHVGTPVGPGHFGYHGRDTLKVKVESHGVATRGALSAARQLYWRERGTRRGERPRMLAHKALAGVRKFIKFYYGNAQWWRL